MDCTHPKISRFENGHRAASVADVHMLLTIYGVDAAEQERLLTLARDSRKRGWWHSYRDVLPDRYDRDVVYLETQLGGLYLEELPEIDHYTRIMEHLRAMATDPARSAAMIHHIEQEVAREG